VEKLAGVAHGMSKRRAFGGLAAACSLACVASPAAARAEGSTTIAGATPLVIGQAVTESFSGPSIGEYFKVSLTGGETLSVALSKVESTCAEEPSMRVYPPSVTDASVGTTSGVAGEEKSLKFVAPATGTWVLAIGIANPCQKIGYTYNASVATGPSETANGGPTVATARPIVLNDTVAAGFWTPSDSEYWKVPLEKGDTFEITLSNDYTQCAERAYMQLFPAGVTEASIGTTAPLAKEEQSLKYVATSTGTLILAIGSANPCGEQAFDYAASVRLSAAALRKRELAAALKKCSKLHRRHSRESCDKTARRRFG
jgi:hypothetical protein